MIYIAHRGLFEGPNSELENRPDQIELALSKGFHVEVDVWWDDGWKLGHDAPTYAVSSKWLTQPYMWLHAKNIEAFSVLAESSNIVTFWHQNDDVTLTTNHYLWTFPGKKLMHNSIMVMPEYTDPELNNTRVLNCAGVCSDWVERIRSEHQAA